MRCAMTPSKKTTGSAVADRLPLPEPTNEESIVAKASSSLDYIETTLHAQISNQLSEKSAISAQLQAAGLYRHAQRLDTCCTVWNVWVYRDSDILEVHPERCKDRLCPVCSSFSSRALRSRVLSALSIMARPRFLTLTAAASRESLCDKISKMKKDFLTLRRRNIMKGCKSGFWMLAISPGPHGPQPHIHCIVDGGYVDQLTLSRAWGTISGSSVVDIRKVYSDGIAAYIVRQVIEHPWTLVQSTDDILELVRAYHGQRLYGAWGACRHHISFWEGGEEIDNRQLIGDLSYLGDRALNGDLNCCEVLAQIQEGLLTTSAPYITY